MKKIISVLLTAIMLFAVTAPCAAAVSASSNIPIIYIRGNGENIVDAEGNLVPATFDDLNLGGEGGLDKDALVEACVNIIKPFFYIHFFCL